MELGRRVPGKDEQGLSQPVGWVLPAWTALRGPRLITQYTAPRLVIIWLLFGPSQDTVLVLIA